MSKVVSLIKKAAGWISLGFILAFGIMRAAGKRNVPIEKSSAFKKADRRRKEIEDTDAADVIALSGCDSESERATSEKKAEFRKRVRDRLGENLQRK